MGGSAPSGGPWDAPDPAARGSGEFPARWAWRPVLFVAAGVFVVLVIIAALVPIPYYAVSPGDASSAEARVAVVGAPSFRGHGEILFVTVTERRLTPLDAFFAWLDPDTDVYTQHEYLGTQTSRQSHLEDLRAMGFSKDVATFVALRHLGYAVHVRDGGAVIDQLVAGAPSAKVLKRNDVITAVDGTPIELPSDISPALKGKQPADLVTLTVRPANATTTEQVTVALTRREDGAAIIGIVAAVPNTVRFEFPFRVDIGTGTIGGPSAGLAFTLATLDRLTPGELAGGHKIAVTGTIDVNGVVGPIGGLHQKTVAVIRAGAVLFIVPRSEMAEAVKAAKGTRLNVVGVDTLDEAISALVKLGGKSLQPSVKAAA